MREAAFDESRARAAFAGRRVLLTGHTGFKGGWLAIWLRRLGADVTALPPVGDGPNLFDTARIADLVDHRVADIADESALAAALADVDADLVIHMAAQSLVRPSYADPVGTMRTNVLGTAAVLDAARRMPSLKGVVAVTSDKCYDNREWVWGYRESDPLGGADPYSASKGCAEIVVDSYRRSFFAGEGAPIVASVRAGNVFGGGDWSVDRLVPDIARAVAAGAPVTIRNPHSVRPWQHVLEPLAGYLQVATAILEGDRRAGEAWNFGPDTDSVVDVRALADGFQRAWGAENLRFLFGDEGAAHPEAGILRLDSTKAKVGLGWRPRLSLDEAIGLTVDWYRAHQTGADMRAVTERQIAGYAAASSASVHPFPSHEPRIEVAACA
jgi:CDP-glucose 4,6-dehydratase